MCQMTLTGGYTFLSPCRLSVARGTLHLREAAPTRAAESESKLELGLVGVDRFGRSRSRSWSWQNVADSDSGPESLADNQQTIVVPNDNNYILQETLEYGRLPKKMSVARRVYSSSVL